MEFKEDEILPKRSKSTEIQSICSEDSVFSMPNLPEELITEIMLRLPVKSLLQFRSVSKSWLSLISTSYFVKTHLLLSASNKDYIHHEVITKASNTSRGVKYCSVSSLLYDSVPESFELDNPGGHLSCVEVKIYSLKRDSWRCIDDFRRQELLAGSAKFVNGKLHWLDKQWNIISIDLADEKWAELERPSCFKQYVFLKLGVLGGDLSASYIYASSHADVWVMKEYGVKESWTKIFTTKSPGYPMAHPLHPTILTSNEGELLCLFGGRLMKYNTKDNMISYLDVSNFGPCLEAEIYVESLICPFSQQG